MGDDGAGQLSPRWHPPFERSGPGTYKVGLGPQDRDLLRELPLQLRDAISANREDVAFRRLFPPAYANDETAEREYRHLVGPELNESRSLALETLAKTADATELSQEQLEAWLRALNDIRLWLGTLLDVREDESNVEPEDPPHMLYHVLTWMQDIVISTLSGDE